MHEERLVRIFCPDCRGRFEVESSAIEEDEVLECSLCGAEVLVLQSNPVKIKLFTEEDDF